jgi:hypothetical protein
MVLVAVITGIAIWLVPVDKKEPPPSLPALPAAPGKVEKLPLPAADALPQAGAEAEQESPEVEQESPEADGTITEVLNGGDGARTYLAGLRAAGAEPDAGVVLAEAQRRQADGKLEDAYLLYRFAARHGESQAALILGTQADPAYHDRAGSYLPEPDEMQAFKWYSVAADAGSEEASRRLKDLRKRVQQDAAGGDAQARRLLLQWP